MAQCCKEKMKKMYIQNPRGDTMTRRAGVLEANRQIYLDMNLSREMHAQTLKGASPLHTWQCAEGASPLMEI